MSAVASPVQTPTPASAETDRTVEATRTRCVVFEADDLGLTHSFNEGIRRAYAGGCLTSTCLRANGYAYREALEGVLPACGGLGVGVHLCLNEGDCVSPPQSVPLLLGGDGKQRSGYLWLMRLARRPEGLEQIEREFRAQIEQVVGDGVPVDHLNSHQHVHMIPPVFALTCRLAVEYGIDRLRLTREPPHFAPGWRGRWAPLANANYAKHLLLNRFARVNAGVADRFGLATTDWFVGVNYTGHMSLESVRAGLAAAGGGPVEVLLHPVVGPDRRDIAYPAAYLADYVAAPERTTELAALTSPGLRTLLQEGDWQTCRFADLRSPGRRVVERRAESI